MVPRRDEFRAPVRRVLATRAANRCSNPDCNAVTSGPGASADAVVDVGMAAHITAAASGGPRYVPSLTPEERRAASNGIWTCQRCGKLIDSDQSKHTVGQLQRWKAEAEARAAQMLDAGVGSIEEPLRLATPWLEPDDSLLSYASTAVERVGRRAELTELSGFLDEDRPFCWWLWTGPSGVGKSRLAVELCVLVSDDWHAGFLRESHQSRLGTLRPLSPTLVVVDYAAQRSDWLSDALLELAKRDTGPPVRVLILERAAAGTWWDRVLRTHRLAESAPIAATQYGLPRELTGLDPDDLRTLIRGVSTQLNHEPSKTGVEDIAEHAGRLDAAGSPLSAFVATIDWLDANGVSAGRDEALRRLIHRATVKLTSGYSEMRASQACRALLLATSLGGLSLEQYTELHSDAGMAAGLLPGVFELPGVDDVLEGLRPDLLGELLVLDQIGAGGVEATASQTLLAAGARAGPEAYTAFVQRAARDHRDHPHLIDLLNVVHERRTWAQLAVDMIPLLRRSDHPIIANILARLDGLHRTDADPNLAELRVTAQFRRANLVMAEGDAARANDLLTGCLSEADARWPVHASLLNNRGITWLHLGRTDLALADFTAVVEAPMATDEARACALNNRADVHEDQNALAAAVGDRTSVLALAETSFNRRYIALSRRARERWALGDRRGTYQDLQAVLDTDDIAVEQKMASRLQRAELLLAEYRIDEAVSDLRIVSTSTRNFDAVEVTAMRLLAAVGGAYGSDRFETCR